MNKRIIFAVGAICIASILFTGCSTRNRNLNYENKIKIVIYPSSGGLSNTYYFVLNINTGKMLITNGVRSRVDIDFSNKHFMMGGRRFETEKEKVYLSEAEVNEIVNLLDLIYADETCINTGMVADSWGIAIYYNNAIVQNNSYYDSDKLNKLINLLRDKTNIEIELTGFA